ncbi:hypothetical protein ACFQ88_33160 [Paenibacillus sp. NPDC056579]|uniref:GAP1-N2 domain-containing protein n=1 Tax=Paenibacillus sp. NPDC056579 TaxID=3345871 RepID=UPI0036B20DCA
MITRAIQQQYFTRDREGIFRTSEGFDTVAKSAALDNTFIKAVLHPYCVYKAPQELLSRDESDEELYPESFVVFHADNGDMVIGRSIYIGTDFTGQRSASFTHQYIVPKDRKESFLREPNRMFRIRGFRSSYDIRDGKAIPELDEIDYDPAYPVADQDLLLTELGIDSRLFQQLLHAVMSSVTSKRKVYIALDTDVSVSSDKAKRLLEVIYRCIPYAFRRQLGFMTFNSEPEGKQNLHAVFVEKGSLRLPDRRLEKDMLFDFPNGKFVNTELPGQEHLLFDTIWKLRNEPEQLQKLFDFCEEGLQSMPAQAALSIPTYYQLCMLYEIDQGSEALYDNNPAGIMHGILTYLNAETIDKKPRFKELFIRMLRKEASETGGSPSGDYVKSLLAYYPIADEGAKALLIQCFVIFINRTAGRTGEGNNDAVQLFELLLQQQDVFGLVMKQLYKQNASSAEQYIAYRMSRANSADSLQAEIDFWLTHAGSIVLIPFFIKEISKKCKILLQKSAHKRVETAEALFAYFESLSDLFEQGGYDEVCRQWKLEIELELLNGLDAAGLSYEDTVRLGFMVDPIDRELFQSADKAKRQTLIVVGLLYRVLKLEPEEEEQALEALRDLGPVDLEQVQEALRRLLRDRIDESRFRLIPFGFYLPSSGSGAGYSSDFDYHRILEYVFTNTSGTETIYDFILWTAENSRFLDGKGNIDPNYKAALSRYFDHYDTRAFRNKAVREKLLATDNESFAVLFKAMKLKQSGSLIRFFVRNKRKLIRSGLVAVPVLALLLFLLWNPLLNWFASFGPPPEIEVGDLPATSTTMNVQLKASVKGEESKRASVKMYLNGQYVANGAIETTVSLHDGENVFEFKAENRGGVVSEVITKKVMYSMPTPTLTHGPIAETSKMATVTITATAKDTNDPSPTIYVNDQAVGQGSVTTMVNLVAGDNVIELKAGNKYGKMSETIKKTVKYNPTVTNTSVKR